jgi:hypothetical protein
VQCANRAGPGGFSTRAGKKKEENKKKRRGGPGRARPCMATWPAWPMQASDGDPTAHGHRFLHARAGTIGRPCSAEKKRAAAWELTGGRRVVDGESRARQGWRGVVQGRLGGVYSVVVAPGSTFPVKASGSRAWGGDVRRPWHGEEKG